MPQKRIYGRFITPEGLRLPNLTVEVFNAANDLFINKTITLNNGAFSSSLDTTTYRDIYFHVVRFAGTQAEERINLSATDYVSDTLTDDANRTNITLDVLPNDHSGFVKNEEQDLNTEAGGTWYRFAQAPNADIALDVPSDPNSDIGEVPAGGLRNQLRVMNMFSLTERSGNAHQSIIFSAGCHYNSNPEFNVIANTGSSDTGASIKKLRILTGDASIGYAPIYLEALIEKNVNDAKARIQATRMASTTSDWTLINFTETEDIPGNMVATELDLSIGDGISSTQFINSERGFKIGGEQVINDSGDWVGDPTNLTGPAGADGAAGEDAFMYVGYAEDDQGVGYSTTPTATSKYIAFRNSDTEISPVDVSTFSGLWTKYQGHDTGYAKNELVDLVTDTGGNWYRFARTVVGTPEMTGQNVEQVAAQDRKYLRVFNPFSLVVRSGGAHQTVLFNAGSHFNVNPMINVEANSATFDGGNDIKKLRILTGTNLYHPTYLEVFIDMRSNHASVQAALLASTGNDWVLMDFQKTDDVPNNMNVFELDLNVDNSISTTHFINSEKGFKVGDTEVINDSGDWVGNSTGLTGPAGADGDPGAQGDPGQDAFVYIGYAREDDGSGFSLTPTATSKYIQVLSTNTEIASPSASNFTGTWAKFQGNDTGYENNTEQGFNTLPSGKWYRFARATPTDWGIDSETGLANEVEHASGERTQLKSLNTFALVELWGHQSIMFTAGHSYDKNLFFNILGNSTFIPNVNHFKKLRFVHGMSSESGWSLLTVYLEVFVESHRNDGNTTIQAVKLNNTGSDWVLTNFEESDTANIPTNMTTTEFDISPGTSLSTNAFINTDKGLKVGNTEIINSSGQWTGDTAGLAGPEGRGITNIELQGSTTLLITYSDTTTQEIELASLVMGLPTEYIVEGIVADASGLPLNGHIVRVYHKDLDTLTKLGSDATTSASGEYEVNFNQDDLDAENIDQLDIIVKVSNGADEELQESPLITQAKAREVVNIAIGSGFKHLIEYNFLNARLSPYLTGDINNYTSPKAITELARKTKSKIEDVNHLVQVKKIAADASTADTTISEDLLYGLSKMKTFSSFEEMALRPNSELKTILQSAVDNGKIPATVKEADIDAFIAALNTAANDDIVNSSTGDMTRLNALFSSTSISTGTDKKTLVQTLLDLDTGDADAFQSSLETALGAQAPAVGEYIDMLGVTSNFTVASHLLALGTPVNAPALATMEKLALIAELESTSIDWETDPRFPGADASEKKENYAQFMLDQAEDQFQTPVFRNKLSGDSDPETNLRDSNVDQFFSNLDTLDPLPSEFKFEGIAIKQYVSENPGTLAGLTDIYGDLPSDSTSKDIEDRFVEDLEAIQRVFKIAPKNGKYDKAKVLWNEKIKSAADIQKMGKTAFTARMKNAATSPTDGFSDYEVNEMFERASDVAARSMHIIANFKGSFNSINPYVIPNMELTGDSDNGELPNLEGLFGSQDLCDCEHCRSVYSAAAYMVDLLQWLREIYVDGNSVVNDPDTPENETIAPHLQKALDFRRPEIKYIDLNCKNTNTPLPYVDLVNEVLENAIASGGIGSTNYNRQTTQKAAYLKAHPEHIISEVYDELRTNIYPWSAPFDMFDAEAHISFHHLGLKMPELIALFNTDPLVQEDDIAAKILKINPLEKAIIIADDATANYGINDLASVTIPSAASGQVPLYYDSATISNLQGNVKILMEKSGLTFNAYKELLLSYFINPTQSFIISFQGSGCLPEEATTNITGAGLLKLMRFHKLREALGWKTIELDRVLLTLNNSSTLDGTEFARIVGVMQLSDNYRTDPEEVATWYGGMSNASYDEAPSYFMEQFVNPSVNNPDEAYPLTDPLNTGSSPAPSPSPSLFDLFDQTDSTTNGYSMLNPTLLQLVTAGTGMAESDIRMLMESASNQDMTLTNLSFIYRVASFCRAMDISVQEYVDYVALFHIDPIVPLGTPIGTPEPAQTMKFIELMEAAKKFGLDSDALKYIMNHDVSTDTALDSDAWITALDTIHEDLQTAQDALIIVGEDSRDTVFQLLNLFLEFEQPTVGIWSQEDLEDIMAIMDGTSQRVALDNGSNESREERIRALFNDVLEIAVSTTDIDNLVAVMINEGPLPYKSPELTEDRYQDALFTGATGSLIQAAVNRMIWPEVRKQVVLTKLVEFFEAEAEVLEELVLNRLQSTDGSALNAVYMIELFTSSTFLTTKPSLLPPSVQNNYVLNGQLLHKNLLLASGMKYGTDGMDYVFDSATTAGLPDLQQLFEDRSGVTGELDKFSTFWNIGAAHHKYASAGSLFNILEQAQGNITSGSGSVVERLENLTGWREVEESISTAVLSLDGTAQATPAWFYDVKTVSMANASSLVSPATIKAWSEVLFTSNIVQDLSNAGKAKYGEAQWLKVGKEMRDDLRVQQRDALADYLIFKDTNFGFTDRYSLFEYFLIDTEMEACMMTTRIVQANSSIQLFVQRLLMNLDNPGYKLSRENVKEWEWRKNYRVWEANRKVFLYPENWIEPELRDDKSPFFKELEDELQQKDITTNTATSAYLNYLEKLDDVAELDVAQLYMDTETDILHVFGRTKSFPHRYYYRQWVSDAWWTPWEKIDQEIEGDHLIPVVYNGRLMLFWPSFLKEANDETKRHYYDDPIYDYQGNSQKKRGDIITIGHRRVALNWTEFTDGKWNKRKRAKNMLEFRFIESDHSVTEKDFYFKTRTEDGALMMDVYQNKPEDNYDTSGNVVFEDNTPAAMTLIGYFGFNGCSKEPTVQNSDMDDNNAGLLYLPLTHHQFHFEKTGKMKAPLTVTAIKGTDIELWVNDDSSDPSIPGTLDFTLLKRLKKHTRLIIPQQINRYSPHIFGNLPFFFEDEVRTMFVRPKPEIKEIKRAGQAQLVAAVAGAQGSNPFGGFGSFSGTGNESNGNSYGQGGFYGSENTGTAVQGGEMFTTSTNDTSWTETIEEFTSRTKYQFHNFRHPHICKIVKQLNLRTVDGLLKPEPGRTTLDDQLDRQQHEVVFFDVNYDPEPTVATPYPVDDFDFSSGGGYSLYNWELFFHAPLMIAAELVKNQRFAEAQKWFHYIFDPTQVASGIDTETGIKRFWRTKPFHNFNGETSINVLMEMLNDGDEEMQKQVDVWRANPFMPHAIARLRYPAYMKNVVMKYIDMLIAWGDQLFTMDTMESVNEALQVYVMAAQILGRRPEEIMRDTGDDFNYSQLGTSGGGFDAFSNALVTIENVLATTYSDSRRDLFVDPEQYDENGNYISTVDMLYFCIPKNDKLWGYWDTVADRLFKIRNCMNIEGVVRQLPIFAPPIDPAMLVKAAAAGLSIGAALADMNAPMPFYKYQYLHQKAVDLTNDLKSLGGGLLSALEKKDAEALSLLRNGQESSLLDLTTTLKKKAIEEAEANIVSLLETKAITSERMSFYKARKKQLPGEIAQLALMGVGIIGSGASGILQAIGAAVTPIPKISTGTSGNGALVDVEAVDGQKIGKVLTIAAGVVNTAVGAINTGASMAGMFASQRIRHEDWQFQSQQAEREMVQIDKQIIAAQIRKSLAEADLDVHSRQLENNSDIKSFMEDKFSNEELYSWMSKELSKIYFQAYKMAYDMAKKAEKAYHYEVGFDDSNSYVSFGLWDSLNKGLLTGEKLHQDLKRLDIAHTDKNKREIELSKRVSLAMVNPDALERLRKTGKCDFDLTEMVYDLDHPGHYRRRIKAVTVSVPCVTGPYTGVTGKLSLLGNKIRMTSQLEAGVYKEQTPLTGDHRFRYNISGIQSISTSSGQNDSGLFELNFNDARYLPFEGAGAVSSWRFELPFTHDTEADAKLRQFDYDTISDLIVTVNYTARDAGSVMKAAVESELVTNLNDWISDLFDNSVSGLYRTFSLKHEFPTQFHQFLHPENTTVNNSTVMEISNRHFPHALMDIEKVTSSVKVLIKFKENYQVETIPADTFVLERADSPGGTFTNFQNANTPLNTGVNNEFGGISSIEFTNTLAQSPEAVGAWKLSGDSTALKLGNMTPVSGNSAAYDANNQLLPEAVEDVIIIMNYKD